ncbi:hypothetical protein, partial [Kordia sp.]|uniref:hypothetical protein n=1 Tax=Kordia sp. TaxID=1965332 RepID=UPI0025B9228E
MKKLLFFAILTCTSLIYSQDLQEELLRMTNVPNSPEAEAFTKYGEVPVDMYTGNPNIGVPIYEYKGKELALPIRLTYDASGVKVEQLATQSGLGWNLNVGGRISRIVNGFPDDFNSAFPEYKTLWDDDIQQKMLSYIQENTHFATEQEVEDYLYFLKYINNNKYDTQPDYFSLNVIGVNDYIVFDVETRQPKTLYNPRIKVEFTQNIASDAITSWVVTNEDGTKFYFEEFEETIFNGDDYFINTSGSGTQPYGLTKNYNSSWVVTRIESANKKDIYEFEYTDLGFWQQPQSASPVQSISNNINDGDTASNNYHFSYGEVSNTLSTYFIKQKFLTHIKHNSNLITSINLKARWDLDLDSAIDKINLYTGNITNELYKTFTFNHSYFGDTAGYTGSYSDQLKVRLKLDGIAITTPTSTQTMYYSFEYEAPEDVPSRNSLAQDYMGYFNNADNDVLYPAIIIGNDSYAGANRYPDFSHAKKGILTKIYYPTGGYTQLNYEPHLVNDAVEFTSSYASNTHLQDVYYLLQSLTGGFDSSVPCDPDCQDTYGSNGAPKTIEAFFDINESGIYEIASTTVGSDVTPIFPSNIEILKKNVILGVYEVIWTYTDGQQSTHLTAGRYKYRIQNPNSSKTITLKVWRQEEVSNVSTYLDTGLFQAAGLRIKSVENYTDYNKLALKTLYQYTTGINISTSSARIVFDPILAYGTSTQVFIQPGASSGLGSTSGIQTFNFVNRISSSSGGSRPHIGYSKVYQIQQSFDGNSSQGYTEYTFNNDGNGPNSGSGIYNDAHPPFANYFITNYEVGKQSNVSVYDANHIKKVETSYQYSDELFYLNKGIFIKRDLGTIFKYPKIVIDPSNGMYTYEFVNVKFGCLEGTVQGLGSFGDCNTGLLAQPCTDGNCISDITLSGNGMYITTAGGRIGHTIKVETKEFFDTGTVEKSIDHVFYGNENHYLPKETSSSYNLDVEKTKYFYPSDYSATVYADMVTKNHLTTQVSLETYKNGEKISTRKNNYNTIGAGFQIANIETAKEMNDLEDRMQLLYYSNGNIKESYQENNIHTVYIWGYNETYLIAKIENANHATMTATQTTAINNAINASNADIDSISEEFLRTKL